MKNLHKYLNYGLLALLAATVVMLFVPAVKYLDESYNGLKVVFGYSISKEVLGSTVTTTIFKFSFMNLLTYLLVIAALVLTLLQVKKANKLFNYVTIGLTLVAGIFFLLTKNFTVVSDSAQKLYEAAGSSFAKDENVKLLFGPIFAAICSFLCCGLCVTKVVLKK